MFKHLKSCMSKVAYPELRLLFRGVVILLVKSLTVMW